MMNPDQIDTFIQLLQKHELVIAALYDKFGDLCPESKKAWQGFAAEERRHARWIGALQTHLDSKTVSFEQTRMTIQSATIAIEYIERQIESIEETQIDLKKALIIALDIEKSLLESAFFKVFKLGGPKADSIRSRLMEATEAHIKRLIDWQKEVNRVRSVDFNAH